MQYKTVAIAGTFDRLHKGHRYFITQAFKFGEKVIIGLTSDEFAFNKRDLRIKIYDLRIRFEDRKRELEEFLRENKLLDRAEIIEIDDVYGPSLKDNDIEALVLTKETREGGEKVNKKRTVLGLKPLEIIEIPLVMAEDDERISSTRIRLGEIDRWGKVFVRALSELGEKIPEKLRLKLKEPLGKLIERFTINDLRFMNNKTGCLISVGDVVTRLLNKLGKQADISIIDFYIKRIRVHEKIEDLGFNEKFLLLKADNPAGHITKETILSIKKALGEFIKDGKKRVIKIEGEEDLAALPSILLAPLGSLVLYGQPDQGVVAVEVTEEKKIEIMEMCE